MGAEGDSLKTKTDGPAAELETAPVNQSQQPAPGENQSRVHPVLRDKPQLAAAQARRGRRTPGGNRRATLADIQGDPAVCDPDNIAGEAELSVGDEAATADKPAKKKAPAAREEEQEALATIDPDGPQENIDATVPVDMMEVMGLGSEKEAHPKYAKTEADIKHRGLRPHHEHAGGDAHNLGTKGRVSTAHHPGELVSVPKEHKQAKGKSEELTPGTMEAYEALVAHARGDSIAAPCLNIVSSYRSQSRQDELFADALAKYGSKKKARKWVAEVSAHKTGCAIDFKLSASLKNGSEYIEQLEKTPAYKWLKANASKYGFAPYSAEPWHWEYNPAMDPKAAEKTEKTEKSDDAKSE